MNATFRSKAPRLFGVLMKEYGLKPFQTAGIVGNGGYESNGFTELHEAGQPPGRGGYGWFQWTGPRRQNFLNWCMSHHLDWKSDVANMSFLVYELDGPYHYVIRALAKTTSVDEASDVFEKLFEAAGVPALEKRRVWSQAALGLATGG